MYYLFYYPIYQSHNLSHNHACFQSFNRPILQSFNHAIFQTFNQAIVIKPIQFYKLTEPRDIQRLIIIGSGKKGLIFIYAYESIIRNLLSDRIFVNKLNGIGSNDFDSFNINNILTDLEFFRLRIKKNGLEIITNHILSPGVKLHDMDYIDD